jgi:lipid-binding SYLF domain-containing protein
MKCTSIILSSMVLAALIGIPSLSGCGSITPSTDNDKQNMDQEAQGTIQNFKTAEPDIQNFFDNAYGYAVLPSIANGALIVGGASGDGEVFEQGTLIGYCRMSQGNIGAQIGGQSFAEIIFFQNAAALANFKAGQTTFDARATAVAAGSGAGKAADYQNGVLVFTKPVSGLMAQAAVGGQGFTFVPLSN